METASPTAYGLPSRATRNRRAARGGGREEVKFAADSLLEGGVRCELVSGGRTDSAH
jgi:hypothetical protein